MIFNGSPTIAIPTQVPMMSTVDITFKAWGIVGPAIWFRPALHLNRCPRLDQMENVSGRR